MLAATPAGHHTLLEPSGLHIDLLAPLSRPASAAMPIHEEAPAWPARDLLNWPPAYATPVPQVRSPSPAPASESGLPLYGLVADEPWPVVPAPVAPAPAAFDALPEADGRSHAHAPTATGTTPGETEHIELNSPSLDAPPVEEAAVDLQWQKALRRARAKADKIAKSREKKAAVAIARAGGPAVAAESEPPFEDAQAPIGVPSFLEDDRPVRSRRRTALRPRTSRWVAVFAALLLVVQVMRQERDVLAARQPGLQPVLALLCNLTGCEVAALRQIGSITIDGAAFARDKDANSYRLSFALRNSAAMPLAMPAVELTLLDTQERAVVRRVILPAEFGAPSVLAASGERAASLVLSLDGADAAALPPVAGYRVLAFYP